MYEHDSIPRRILIYGALQELLVIGFGAAFFADSAPPEADNPEPSTRR